MLLFNEVPAITATVKLTKDWPTHKVQNAILAGCAIWYPYFGAT
jgi:hypothetical protein